jgi:hypothetical protein
VLMRADSARANVGTAGGIARDDRPDSKRRETAAVVPLETGCNRDGPTWPRVVSQLNP